MGPGFLEAVYHECLEIEFHIRKILYISKPRLKLYYKTRQLEKYYEVRFFGLLKYSGWNKSWKMLNKKMLSLKQGAQIINSLKESKQKVGLLINFGELSLKFKRFIYWNGSDNRNNHITDDIQQVLGSI